MSDTAHTPTPWIAEHRGTKKDIQRGTDHFRVGTAEDVSDIDAQCIHIYGSRKAVNAAHIVKCVNENEALHKRIAELEADSQWQDIATAPKDVLVIVYTPPQPHDYPDAFHVDFDYIDTGIADDYWYNHGEAHEHFSCVGKPEGSIGGIPENAPYTHWMPFPAAPVGEA